MNDGGNTDNIDFNDKDVHYDDYSNAKVLNTVLVSNKTDSVPVT